MSSTAPAEPRAAEALLQIRGLSKRFPVAHNFRGQPTSWLWAVDAVDLDLSPGETVALVGESGCGKTTLARLALKLIPASAGSVRFESTDVLSAEGAELRAFRRRAQMIFQDPYGSLDPRMTVLDIVAEGLAQEGRSLERKTRIAELLDLVELTPDAAWRYPHEFSAGQRQRIAIARALAVEPKLLIADEPVSALDVSVQSRILNLLVELQRELDLTYLFVTHDLSIVRHLADRIAVMYLGRIVETASATELFENPLHPYTQALLSSVPGLPRANRGGRVVLEGEVPSPIDPPTACRFASRCFRTIDRCTAEVPLLDSANGNASHTAACFNFEPLSPTGDVVPEPDPVRAPRSCPDPRVQAGGRDPALARFILRRVLFGILLLFLASILFFGGLNAAPGFPRIDPADADRIGLDEPVGTQYALFIRNLLTGDPGVSLRSGAPIGEIIKDSGLNTLKLGAAAVILVYAIALPLGVLAAWRRDSYGDKTIRVVAVLAMGIPNFFLAILVIQLFAVELGWFPVAGPGGFHHLALPAIVLALESLAINLRLMRSSMIDELAMDYVRALRGKGLAASRIMWVHALRNALPPVIAFAGIIIPLILGYALVVEVIFRFEGLGFQLVQSILTRDYILGTTLALLFLAVVIVCNLLADIGQRLLDPRARDSS